MATEMPAAIRPYSMAVAPDSSRKRRTNFDISKLPHRVPLFMRCGPRTTCFYVGPVKETCCETFKFFSIAPDRPCVS
jgi:hypothetical protein